MFLDISKAFDKVWHKRINFRLKKKGISENLLELSADLRLTSANGLNNDLPKINN